MSFPEHSTDQELILSISQRIDTVLSNLLPRGSKCAFLDFPNHSNTGDSAIWLGESEWLKGQDVRVAYSCDVETYSKDRLSALLPEGAILLHGGGNLGDFWVYHQKFREQVIEDFPDHKIIQLPQTIYF